MRVLYVNQTADISGAERSLLSLWDGLGDRVEPLVACPDGPFAEQVEARGVRREPIVGTEASFRLHPVHTSRGLAEIGRSALQVRGLARRLSPDLVHANTTRAALLALLARHRRPPVLAHVRDWAPAGRFSRLVLGVVGRRADLVVANSEFVARQFDGLRLRHQIEVVHNPVDLRRFDPGSVDRDEVRRELGLAPGELTISVVAQLTPWKGQDDAIRILAALRSRGLEATLLLAGSAKFGAAGTQFDNRSFERRLHDLAAELGVAETVRFLGERDDPPRIMAATDVLLVPSWQEAFGRVVIEAMAMGVPVAATDNGGPAEVVRPGEDGLLLPPRRPDAWASALAPLLENGTERERLGAAGRERARRFGLDVHAERMLSCYALLAGAAGVPAG